MSSDLKDCMKSAIKFWILQKVKTSFIFNLFLIYRTTKSHTALTHRLTVFTLYSKYLTSRFSYKQVYMLAAVYTAFGFTGAFIMLALKQLPTDSTKRLMSVKNANCACPKTIRKPKTLIATLRLLTDHRLLLLIPLTFFNGLQQGFFSSDFTQVSIRSGAILEH